MGLITRPPLCPPPLLRGGLRSSRAPTGVGQKKLPIVNSKSLWFSYGSGASGKPHSKRSGPSGENQRMPKPVDVRTRPRLSGNAEARAARRWSNCGAGVVLQNCCSSVPRVAGVEEDDAADADLVDDRELELEVLVRLEVAADVRAVRDGRRVRVERRGERQARADAAQVEAADVEDAAEEVALEDGHALRVGARDEADLGVQLEDEARAGHARCRRRAGSRSGP